MAPSTMPKLRPMPAMMGMSSESTRKEFLASLVSIS